MKSVRRGQWAAVLFLPVVLWILVGCSNTTQPLPEKGEETKAPDDPFQEAREVVRLATSPGPYQKALEMVNAQLAAQPSLLTPFQVSAKEKDALIKALGKHAGSNAEKLDAPALSRKLLVERIGLDEDELREVETDRFSPLDAHYLDFCFWLRDAARSLRQGDRAQPRLDQIKQAFDWVMRQVALDVRSPELQPPEFALRQGFGGPRERALVFLALLRQMDLEGCMLAYRGKDGPVYWLVGALLRDKDASQVYLFDPRLGLPVPGPNGGIATLAQLRKQPDLLKRFNGGGRFDYDVKPQQAKEAEVYLVMPLSALSARMRFLEEEVFAAHDRVILALRPSRVLAQFEAAGVGPVHIWNERGTPGTTVPMTPTRVLRQSLPPQEGGVDAKGERYRRLHEQRIPWFPIAQSFRELRIDEDLPIVYQPLRAIVFDLFQTYVLTPHQQIVRGRYEDAAKRLVRLEQILQMYEDDVQANNFQEQFAQWRDLIKDAFNKGGKDKALQVMMEEDPLFLTVRNPDEPLLQAGRNPDEPKAEPKKIRKGTLGLIIFRAAGDVFRKEALYLQALRWQEKAERQQARLGTAGGSKGRVAQAAADAWQNARAGWEQYQGANPITPALIAGRVQEAWNLLRTGRADLAEMSTQALDQLLRDTRQSLVAQSLRARATLAMGDSNAAGEVLTALVNEADSVLKSRELQTTRRQLEQAYPETSARLFGDLAPTGAFHWIAYQARLELIRQSGK